MLGNGASPIAKAGRVLDAAIPAMSVLLREGQSQAEDYGHPMHNRQNVVSAAATPLR